MEQTKRDVREEIIYRPEDGEKVQDEKIKKVVKKEVNVTLDKVKDVIKEVKDISDSRVLCMQDRVKEMECNRLVHRL